METYQLLKGEQTMEEAFSTEINFPVVFNSSLDEDRKLADAKFKVKTDLFIEGQIIKSFETEHRFYNHISIISYLLWHLDDLVCKLENMHYDEISNLQTSVFFEYGGLKNLLYTYNSRTNDDIRLYTNSLVMNKIFENGDSFYYYILNTKNNYLKAIGCIDVFKEFLNKLFLDDPNLNDYHVSEENIAFCVWGYLFNELKRYIQVSRKDLGFEIEDRINVTIGISDNYHHNPVYEMLLNYVSALKSSCLINQLEIVNENQNIELKSDVLERLKNWGYDKHIEVSFSISK